MLTHILPCWCVDTITNVIGLFGSVSSQSDFFLPNYIYRCVCVRVDVYHLFVS